MIEKVKSLGAGLTVLLLFIAGLFVISLLIGGVSWASDRLLPWFAKASLFAFVVLVLILLPLSAIRATRTFALTLIMLVSYLFGVTLWMDGFLTTLQIWGIFAVVIGLFFMGVGVVPIAILATIFHGMWTQLLELVILTIVTFGSRFFSLWMAEKHGGVPSTQTYINDL